MKLRKFTKHIIFVIVLLVIITIIYTVKATIDEVHVNSSSIIVLDDGWTMALKGTVTENVYLPDANIGRIDESDVIEISHTLDDYGAYNPCLSFFTQHAITDVYLNDELIYTMGKEYVDKKRSVPSKQHSIPLGGDYVGKTLKISLTGSRSASFSNLGHIYIGKRNDILTKEIGDKWFAILIGLFLFTLGIVLIILSPYLFVYHDNDLRILFSGLISILLAIYIMAFNGIFDILLNKPFLNSVLEYASLYNIPTTVAGYLMSTYVGKERTIFRTMFFTNLSLFAGAVVLFVFHLYKISDFLIFLHVICAVEGITAIVIIIRTYILDRKDMSAHAYSSDNLFVIGLTIFMIMSLLDIINYNFIKYFSVKGQQRASLKGFTFGALIFVTCLLLSYFFYTIYSSSLASMQSRMLSLAYNDTLTGLSNRARCEQMLAFLTAEQSMYAIVSLDLNYLKKVNDTLGHHEGDRLLNGFSTILTDCFWDANLIGRMGGDEFIVILTDEHSFYVTKRIHELYSMIGEWNNKEQHFKYSAAYGYAYSYEVPNGSAKEVYMLADSRMYEMKREQHENPDQEVQ